jgi:formamidopyrimidine-DNA glycosylase
MIELPEAITIARQMTVELKGKVIQSCMPGNSPHKFAFYNHTPEEYEEMLPGKRVGDSIEQGVHILTRIGADHVLALGGGGERIFIHPNEKTLPKKHQFLLQFEDETYLSVTIQMWGSLQLLHDSEIDTHPYIAKRGESPLSDAFTFDYFNSLFETLEQGDPRAVKFFMISKPGIWGVGNGCLHDILFLAKIHPRRRAVDLRLDERQALYDATRSMLHQAAVKGGRDSELDLYGCPGGYKRIFNSKSTGQPCSACGTPIEKIQFLGGASYFCPQCQEQYDNAAR